MLVKGATVVMGWISSTCFAIIAAALKANDSPVVLDESRSPAAIAISDGGPVKP